MEEESSTPFMSKSSGDELTDSAVISLSETEEQFRWFSDEVHPHETALRVYLRRKFPAMHDVDDVLQESYVKILQAPPVGKIASTKAYLFAVARNAAIKVLRKRRIISDVPV